jgi:hypothetical protein
MSKKTLSGKNFASIAAPTKPNKTLAASIHLIRKTHTQVLTLSKALVAKTRQPRATSGGVAEVMKSK